MLHSPTVALVIQALTVDSTSTVQYNGRKDKSRDSKPLQDSCKMVAGNGNGRECRHCLQKKFEVEHERK